MNRELFWQSGLFPNPVLQGSTTKALGVFRFGRATDEVVRANRQRFAEELGIPQSRFVLTEQVHGNTVFVANEETPEAKVKADGIVTQTSGLLLVVKTSDCVPVSFYDPETNAIGVAHAGWKGLALDVVGETIKTMAKQFGIKPADLFVAIGPAICVDHYDVTEAKDDRITQFEARLGATSPVIRRQAGKIAFDLPLAAKELCLKQGVKAENIEVCGSCTFEHPNRWPSYRREQNDWREDIWSFIAVKG